MKKLPISILAAMSLVLLGSIGSIIGFCAETADDLTKCLDVYLTDDLPYAGFSQIHSDPARLWLYQGADAKGITVCVNAGHGTAGGGDVMTQCHPDGTPKVTGGSTDAGAVYAAAVSSGMTFPDGTAEAEVTLRTAVRLRELLLNAGYNVLMIRENDNTQLDNIARTVLANQYADCHVAIHWDSTGYDKGAYYCSVPAVGSYRAMEPVASTWERSHALGDALIRGLSGVGVNIFENGSLETDLTQTSYSSVPSVDIECGDAGSDISDARLQQIAEGLFAGIELWAGEK